MYSLLPLRRHIRRFPERRIVEASLLQRFGPGGKSFKAIIQAMDDISETHYGLKRKNEESKLVHERRIVGIADFYNVDDPLTYVVIFLHDTLEDYKELWTPDRIEKGYGAQVSCDVQSLTNPEWEEGMTEADYNNLLYLQLKKGGRRVVRVKCYDRLESMLNPWKGGRERMLAKANQTLLVLIPLAIEFEINIYPLVTAISMLQRRYGLHRP